MFSKILAVPLAIGGLFYLYMAWEVDPDYALYIIPCVLLGALIYIFSPQLDWWWYKRRPPELDAPIRRMLTDFSPFYNKLSVQNKKLFRDRMALYIKALEFSPMVMENFPEDVKAVIAAQAVQISFGQEKFLFEPYEKIILYPEAFPSPQFPEHRHSTEHFEEDGVILFSAKHLMTSYLNTKQYLPIGLYEFARLYRQLNPDLTFPKIPEDPDPLIHEISKFKLDLLQKWIGLPEIDDAAVLGVLFFTHPANFKAVAPQLYTEFYHFFKQDKVD